MGKRILYVILVLLAGVVLLPNPGNAEVRPLVASFIDVGQGCSTLFEFPNGKTLMLDCGLPSAGPRVVAYLKQRNISKLDALVISHPHEDHLGGASAVLDAVPVMEVWRSGMMIEGSRLQGAFLQTLEKRGIRTVMPDSGSTLMVGDVRIDILITARSRTPQPHEEANCNNLVLRITYGTVSFLLTSDMVNEQRAQVKHWPRSTVLQVAHHGMPDGTDDQFAQEVSPRYAVVSCGDPNYYHCPHPGRRQRLTKSQCANRADEYQRHHRHHHRWPQPPRHPQQVMPAIGDTPVAA